jgi:TRAP-type C4-dicarboxylate transport system permease small subunit
MRTFALVTKGVSTLLYWFSSVAIVFVVFLTVFDVIMRRFDRPVDFAVESVTLLAGVIIAFALPATSLANDHVIMEFIDGKLPQRWLRVAWILSRCLGIVTFAVIGLSALKLGNGLRVAGQCSPILRIPEFPLPYALGVACFVECMVLFTILMGNINSKEKL